MTTIYRRMNATGYEIINTHSYEDLQALNGLHGPSRMNNWTPPRVQRVCATRRGGNKPSDLPHSGLAFILRRSAVEALQDILEAHGELLPLATNDGVELYVFNPRFVLDAIDRERSTLEYVPESTTIWVKEYVFIESVIRGIDIFHDTFGYNLTYFSDRFVERVKKAKLKGTE
ncbi:MAG TPA: hypothetical protein PK156_46315, partial [Polyangium sp.]|nr:hypothetical protein [Polyangium sp.]